MHCVTVLHSRNMLKVLAITSHLTILVIVRAAVGNRAAIDKAEKKVLIATSYYADKLIKLIQYSVSH